MKRALIALTIFLFPALAAAESATFGPVTLDVPPGWTALPVKDKTLTLKAPGEGRDGGFVVVMLGTGAPGRLDQTFADFARGLTKGGFKPDRVQPRRTAEGRAARTVRGDTEITVKGQTFDEQFHLVGIQGERAMLGLGLITLSTHAELTHEADFRRIVKSVKIDGPPPLLAVTRPSASADGFFIKNGLVNRINPFGGMDLVATRDYLLLRPGGFAYQGSPPGGTVDDPAAIRKADPASCGTYHLDGKTLTLTWPDEYGLLYDEQMAADLDPAGRLASPGDGYGRIDPLKDRKLNKSFRAFSYTGGPQGGVASEHVITFAPDGTFARTGFVGTTFDTTNGPGADGGVRGTVNSERPAETGTYRFDGLTMTLTPKGGKPERHTAFMADGGDGMLVLDDTAYLAPDEEKK